MFVHKKQKLGACGGNERRSGLIAPKKKGLVSKSS